MLKRGSAAPPLLAVLIQAAALIGNVVGQCTCAALRRRGQIILLSLVIIGACASPYFAKMRRLEMLAIIGQSHPSLSLSLPVVPPFSAFLYSPKKALTLFGA
jgi:hypothetical protein